MQIPKPASAQLKVLTLNCWGVPGARDRKSRIQAIGMQISQMDLDVVGLQEIFYETDRQIIIEWSERGGLIFNHYYDSGLFGSGLLLLSRFPILETDFWQYSLNGRPHDLIRLDYYAGKGLAYAKLETSLGPIDFYNTHLIAPYLEIGDDVYFSHRVGQAWEIVSILNRNSDDAPLILVGDFNTTSDRLTYRTCSTLGKLKDSYLAVNKENLGFTVTTDIPYIFKHEPERLDYIFYRNGGSQIFEVENSEVTLTEVDANLTNHIRGYSDHYGVQTNLILIQQKAEVEKIFVDNLLEEITLVFEAGSRQAALNRSISTISTSLSGLLVIIFASLRRRYYLTRRDFLKLICQLLLLCFFVITGLGFGSMMYATSEMQQFEKIMAELEMGRTTN